MQYDIRLFAEPDGSTTLRWEQTITALDDEDMRRWHVEFERQAPEAHQEFLESLGIEAEEAAAIRARAREGTR